MERMIFCRTGLQIMWAQFASVGLVLAHVGRFWASLQNVRLHVGLCRLHLGPCWDHIRLILGHFGTFWHHIGLMLSHFYQFWCILWSVLASVLDLGISVLLSFGFVGVYFGFGRFSVVELRPCWPNFWFFQVVRKRNVVNNKKTTIVGLRCSCF